MNRIRQIRVSAMGLAAMLCLVSDYPADWNATGTVYSADGEVQIQTEYPSGKVSVLRPTPLEMASVRQRAEAGIPSAQMIMSDIEYALKHETEGERWLRRAARSGNIHAECRLGEKLTFYLEGSKRPDEGVLWLKLAAYEGHPGAQTQLARCYHFGAGVEKNDYEAYYWSLVAIRSEPGAKTSSDELAPAYPKSLSPAQLTRAESRARSFTPSTLERNALLDYGLIKLKAISESNGKPIVVLNDTTFSLGEQKKLKWLSKGIEIRCLQIKTNGVAVVTEPYWQRGELTL